MTEKPGFFLPHGGNILWEIPLRGIGYPPPLTQQRLDRRRPPDAVLFGVAQKSGAGKGKSEFSNPHDARPLKFLIVMAAAPAFDFPSIIRKKAFVGIGKLAAQMKRIFSGAILSR
jgi:hypothetical protein